MSAVPIKQKSNMFEEAKRIKDLPTYVFDLIDKLKTQERAKGTDVIDLSMGSPDLPTPPPIVEAMKEALDDPISHRYPSFDGLKEFRASVEKWCHEQYGIKIDPNKEILPLIGSKEGLVHFALAFVNPGDTTLVPMPAYPAHFRGTLIAGGIPIVLPTNKKTNYIPDLSAVDSQIADRAKILFLSYPTNPTGAVVPKSFFEKSVEFARKHNLILVHDFAYAEIYFDGKKPISILEIPGAKDIAIEFHTLSKTFSMAGWRIGFVIGNSELVQSIRKMKTNLDYGLFAAVQKAGIAALNMDKKYLDERRRIYQKRRDVFVEGIRKLGWKIEKPMASFYVWLEVPFGYNSLNFCKELLNKAGIAVSPGIGFGDLGEGYIRVALIDTEDRIKEALNRMEKAGIKYNNN